MIQFALVDNLEFDRNDAIKKLPIEFKKVYRWSVIGPTKSADKKMLPHAMGQIYGIFSDKQDAKNFMAMLVVRQRVVGSTQVI